MDKRIVFTRKSDGGVSVVVPTIHWEREYRMGAAIEDDMDVTLDEFLDWELQRILERDSDLENGRIIDVKDMPVSRNYRNAWTDSNPTETVDIDIAKAAIEQRKIIIQKAKERVPADEFGRQSFDVVEKEIDALGLEQMTDINQIYNTFPASINIRASYRECVVHKGE